MKVGFYPGCSLKGSSREYRESLLAVSQRMGISLEEVPDWNCCGATSAHNLNRELSLALPARILAGAEKAGMEELVVPCAACYNRLAFTHHELMQDEELRGRISGIIESGFQGKVRLLNIVQFLDQYLFPGIRPESVSPLGIKVACYYGCLLVRPPKIVEFDRAEEPDSMDRVARIIGAEPIEWAYKTECCGAGFSVSRTDLVGKLSGLILEDAVDRGAEAILVACPMCHSNLDMRRKSIQKYTGKSYSIPVLYITQALGVAMGISTKQLGLHRHFVPLKTLFRPRPAKISGRE